jgi:hypothetical protein
MTNDTVLKPPFCLNCLAEGDPLALACPRCGEDDLIPGEEWAEAAALGDTLRHEPNAMTELFRQILDEYEAMQGHGSVTRH